MVAHSATRGDGLRLLRRQVGRARTGFAIGAGGGLLYGAMTVASSVVVGRVTDQVLLAEEPTLRAAWLGVALVLGVSLLRATGIVGRRWGGYTAQYMLQVRDRREVTRKYLALGIPWHRRHAAGTLLSNASSDIDASAQIAAPIPMALGATLMLIGTAVLLVLTDPWLAAIGFLVGPAIALANSLFARRMRAAAAVAQSTRGDVAEVAHESFDGALVIKTLGREQEEIARFDDETGRLRDNLIVQARLRAMFDPVVQALPNLGVLAIIVVGAVRVDQGLLSAGTLVTFAYLFRMATMPMRVFGWMLGILPSAAAGHARVQAVLDAEGEVVHGTADLPGTGPVAVTAQGVSFHHPRTSRADLRDGQHDAARADVEPVEPGPPGVGDLAEPAAPTGAEPPAIRGVEGVDLSIDAGRTVALVGPTGAGKTTLASLLVRLVDPDHGTVAWDGTPLPSLRRGALAEAAALVFQDAFLFDTSIRENVALGRTDLDDAAVWHALARAHVDDVVAALPAGLDTVVGERGATLSGGQRQRIALARALVRSPRLLVLDDATSAVDPAIERRILTELAAQGADTTVVVVAYRLSAIELADEVVFVQDGTVADRGTHAHLMATNQAYADLVSAYEQERDAAAAPQMGGGE